jgi:hypothetical protein
MILGIPEVRSSLAKLNTFLLAAKREFMKLWIMKSIMNFVAKIGRKQQLLKL